MLYSPEAVASKAGRARAVISTQPMAKNEKPSLRISTRKRRMPATWKMLMKSWKRV
ncbi:hypothetical protein D3C72_2372360 [compost metagenome]